VKSLEKIVSARDNITQTNAAAAAVAALLVVAGRIIQLYRL